MAQRPLTLDKLISKLKAMVIEEKDGIANYRKLAKDIYSSFDPSPDQRGLIHTIEFIARDEEKHRNFLREELNKLINNKRRR